MGDPGLMSEPTTSLDSTVSPETSPEARPWAPCTPPRARTIGIDCAPRSGTARREARAITNRTIPLQRLQTPSKRMMMGCVAMVGGLAAARVLVDLVAAFVRANGDPCVMSPLTRRGMVRSTKYSASFTTQYASRS